MDFTTGQLAGDRSIDTRTTDSSHDQRRVAYDRRKLRAKQLVSKVPASRRYSIPQQAARTIAALVILRSCSIDEHYEAVRQDMSTLMEDLRIAV
jgi:hypothetical protein